MTINIPEIFVYIAYYAMWIFTITASIRVLIILINRIINESRYLPHILLIMGIRAIKGHELTWRQMITVKRAVKANTPDKFKAYQKMWEDEED